MGSSKGLQVFISCMLLGAGLAVRINEDGHKIIYLPKGESVKLGCPFSSDPEDNTPDNDWDIQWKQVKPGSHPQYNPLLGYHDHRIIYPGPPDLQKRVGFISSDPSLYDASMQLRDLQMSDSATYECTVKKTTEATRKVTITVQEKPALPRCWIIGEIAYGEDITLRCFTSTGTPPLSYHWSMASGNYHDWMPSASVIPGDLQIRDLCDDHVGTYQCSVGNNVGVAYCSVEIQFGGGWSRGWIIAGSIIIALLTMAIIIGGVIWCCWCCWGKGGGGCCGDQCPSCYCGKEYCWDCCCSYGSETPEKHQQYSQTKASDICVDAEAPHSRPCSQAISRASSLHSLLGYQTKGIPYSQGRKYTPPIVQVKMSSPPDSDVSVVLPLEIPSPPDSEQGEISEPYYPPKGSTMYPDPDPCCEPIKVDNIKGSRSQIYCDPHNYTSACSDPTGLRWKDGNSRQYKGAVVMMRSSSRDGLLI
ncbi:V-set and immunoglobulin domain-containing protein 8-like [Pituophis catenifer annectens]|uniref:V-set and immunoglobulin domain-containing protein 8-like n=1 Tax=Pituophis catenifer annectens TaxID=94852 RepID=UPI0039927467